MVVIEMIKEVLSRLRVDEPLVVHILTRDENSCVIKKQAVPVAFISGLYEGEIIINVEESSIKEVDIF